MANATILLFSGGRADYGIMSSVLCVCLAFYMFIKIPLKDLPNILQAFDLSG